MVGGVAVTAGVMTIDPDGGILTAVCFCVEVESEDLVAAVF